MKYACLALLFFMLALFATSQIQRNGFTLRKDEDKKQVAILYNGKTLTNYCYTDSISKPFLYPVTTLRGDTVTRRYPAIQLAGEPTDHPHHIGIWMNYESVNGIDFWNNSSFIPSNRKQQYGTIQHQQIKKMQASGNHAQLEVTATWKNYYEKVFLEETTQYFFEVHNNIFSITRNTRLTALDTPVVFKDAKDGFFAIRVAKELQMPSQNKDSNTVQNGMYYASNGLIGDSVWSSKGVWAMLKGKVNNRMVTIGMFDHPKNPGYPTYWHARGYGLFALNPLGRAVFSKGKDVLQLTLQPHEHINFCYQLFITNEAISPHQMDIMADRLSKRRY